MMEQFLLVWTVPEIYTWDKTAGKCREQQEALLNLKMRIKEGVQSTACFQHQLPGFDAIPQLYKMPLWMVAGTCLQESLHNFPTFMSMYNYIKIIFKKKYSTRL